MGNFQSSFDFTAKPIVARLSWDRVQQLWQKAEKLIGEKHDETTACDRLLFMDIFTDTSEIEQGKVIDAPLPLFRAFDYGYKNKVTLYHLFPILALFCDPRNASAEARWQWCLRTFFAKGAAADPQDAATAADIVTAITCLNRALLILGIVSRPVDAGEVVQIVESLCLELAGRTHDRKVSVTKLVKWLTTTKAMTTLVIRCQMLQEQYEKLATTGSLPTLLAMAETVGRRAAGPTGPVAHKLTAQEQESIREKALRAVASRPVLADLSGRTGLSLPQLMKLRREFGSVSMGSGTLDLNGFKVVMCKHFPALASDTEKELYLGIRGRRSSVDIHGRKASAAEQAARRGSTARAIAGLPSLGVEPIKALNGVKEKSTLDRLFEAFDADNSGVIEFREFVTGCARMAKGSVRDKADLLFSLLDAQGLGSVTLDDMARFVSSGASELQAIHDNAIKTVATVPVKTDGMITEPEFVTIMLADPALPGWFGAVTHAAPITLIQKALEEITEILSLGQKMLSGSAGAPTSGASAARRLNVMAGVVAAPGQDTNSNAMVQGRAAPVQVLFTFDRLLSWWSERLMAMDRERRRAAVNAGQEVSGRAPPRIGGPAVGIGATPEGHLVMKDTCDEADVMALLEYAFELEELNPKFRHGYKGAVTFLFEALVAASSPEELQVGDANSPSSRAARIAALEKQHATRQRKKDLGEEVSFSDALTGFVLPTKTILHFMGLCLGRTPEELALVIFRDADRNDDGSVPAAELQSYISEKHMVCVKVLKEAQSVLDNLDLDGDGRITEMEFRAGLARFPGLFDACGMLMGGQGNVSPVQSQQQYKMSGNRRGSAGGLENTASGGVTASNAATAQGRTGPAVPALPLAQAQKVPTLPAWAVAGGGTSAAKMAVEGAEYSKLTLEEQIKRRHRSYAKKTQKIEVTLGTLATEAQALAKKIAPIVHHKFAELAEQVQQDKMGVYNARQLLKDMEVARSIAREATMPATARSATSPRPGTALKARAASASVARGNSRGGRPATSLGFRSSVSTRPDTSDFAKQARLSPRRPSVIPPVEEPEVIPRDKFGVPLPEGSPEWWRARQMRHNKLEFRLEKLVVKPGEQAFDDD